MLPTQGATLLEKVPVTIRVMDWGWSMIRVLAVAAMAALAVAGCANPNFPIFLFQKT